MNAPSRSLFDGKATMSPCSVETMTAGSRLLTWRMPTIEFAELLARKLSVAAIDDPTYPNPFCVVESNGQARSHYLRGTRHAETIAA